MGYLSEKDRNVGKEIPGFYAEDMERYYPDGVRYNSDGLPEDWNERKVMPAILKLLQEQKKQIDILNERTEKLEQIIRGEE